MKYRYLSIWNSPIYSNTIQRRFCRAIHESFEAIMRLLVLGSCWKAGPPEFHLTMKSMMDYGLLLLPTHFN